MATTTATLCHHPSDHNNIWNHCHPMETRDSSKTIVFFLTTLSQTHLLNSGEKSTHNHHIIPILLRIIRKKQEDSQEFATLHITEMIWNTDCKYLISAPTHFRDIIVTFNQQWIMIMFKLEPASGFPISTCKFELSHDTYKQL